MSDRSQAIKTATRAAEWGLAVALFFVAGGISAAVTTWWVVKGTGSAPLEDQVGKNAWEASVWLSERGWTPRLDHFEDSETFPPHTVISTDPVAGAELRPGAVVRLSISRGARRIPMPNVSGIHIDQARLILSRNGLAMAGVLPVHAESAPDTVLATSPAPTAQVGVGESVRVLVSMGPQARRWVMPQTEGFAYEAAQRVFDQMGVSSRVVARLYDPAEPVGVVIEQFPPAGEPVSEGQVVRLTLNERAKTAPTGPRSAARLVPLRILIPKGFAAREVVVRVARDDWHRTVLHRLGSPGGLLRHSVFVGPGDRVTVTIDEKQVWMRRY